MIENEDSSRVTFTVIGGLGTYEAFREIINEFNKLQEFDFTVEVELIEGMIDTSINIL